MNISSVLEPFLFGDSWRTWRTLGGWDQLDVVIFGNIKRTREAQKGLRENKIAASSICADALEEFLAWLVLVLLEVLGLVELEILYHINGHADILLRLLISGPQVDRIPEGFVFRCSAVSLRGPVLLV